MTTLLCTSAFFQRIQTNEIHHDNEITKQEITDVLTLVFSFQHRHNYRFNARLVADLCESVSVRPSDCAYVVVFSAAPLLIVPIHLDHNIFDFCIRSG